QIEGRSDHGIGHEHPVAREQGTGGEHPEDKVDPGVTAHSKIAPETKMFTSARGMRTTQAVTMKRSIGMRGTRWPAAIRKPSRTSDFRIIHTAPGKTGP